MKKCFLILLIIFSFSIIFSQAIIIGRSNIIISMFENYNEQQIKGLAEDISMNYNKVVLNLGARYPFRHGGLFQNEKRIKNLEFFSKYLNDLGLEFYLWIFNTYGSEQFIDLYLDKDNLINENIRAFEELDIIYDGVIIDLEWINIDIRKGFDAMSCFNNPKYLEFIGLLRETLPKEKKLMAFASIMDNNEENYARGYDLYKMFDILDTVIPMLYIEDDSFVYRNNKLTPLINDRRIDSMLDFYKNYSQIEIATSINKGLIVYRNDRYSLIRSISIEDLPNGLNLIEIDTNKYYTIKKYRVTRSITILRNDGRYVHLRTGETVYYYYPNDNLIQKAKFIWNYSLSIM